MAVTIVKHKKPRKPSTLPRLSHAKSVNEFQRPLIRFMGDKPKTMSDIAYAFPDIKLPTIRYQVAQMVKVNRLIQSGLVGANKQSAIHYTLNKEWATNFPEWKEHFLNYLAESLCP